MTVLANLAALFRPTVSDESRPLHRCKHCGGNRLDVVDPQAKSPVLWCQQCGTIHYGTFVKGHGVVAYAALLCQYTEERLLPTPATDPRR